MYDPSVQGALRRIQLHGKGISQNDKRFEEHRLSGPAVLFTNTVSHKMVRCALNETKGRNTKIARSHRSSMAALRSILEEHVS